MRKLLFILSFLAVCVPSAWGQSDVAQYVKSRIITARELLEKGDTVSAVGIVAKSSSLVNSIYAQKTLWGINEYMLGEYLCHNTMMKAGNIRMAEEYHQKMRGQYNQTGSFATLIYVNVTLDRVVSGIVDPTDRLMLLVTAKDVLINQIQEPFDIVGIDMAYIGELCDFELSVDGMLETLRRLNSHIDRYPVDEIIRTGYSLVANKDEKKQQTGILMFREAVRHGKSEASIIANSMFPGWEKAAALAKTNDSVPASAARRACEKALSLLYDTSGSLPDFGNIAQTLLPYEEDPEIVKYGGAYCLGTLYEHGAGVRQDTDKAMAYYMNTALDAKQKDLQNKAYLLYRQYAKEKDYRHIMQFVGDRPLSSFSSPEVRHLAYQFAFAQAYDQEMQCLTLLAIHGDGKAYNDVGLRLHKGDRSPKNRELAFDFFKAGADLGYLPAIYNYAISLFYGYGTMPDVTKALELSEFYIKAARELDATDFSHLELLTSSMSGAVPEHEGIKKGRVLHLESEYFGRATHCIEHGVWLKLQRTEPSAKVLYYLERAYTRLKNKTESAVQLGILYYMGFIDMPSDGAKAHSYFEKALPDKTAQWYMGLLYESGKGVDKDLHKALEYYRLASASGLKDATNKVAAIEKRLSATIAPTQ